MTFAHAQRIWLLPVLALLLVPATASSQTLLGHWTFDDLTEETGNFGDLTLFGSASISGGVLSVQNGDWARAINYTGPVIAEKTLIATASITDLGQRGGSILTLDRINSDVFDAIVYAERQPQKWMAGSNSFTRTMDLGTEAIQSNNDPVQMAISYRMVTGGTEITVCKNGFQIGQYIRSPLATHPPGDAEVLFGTRHTPSGTSPRGFTSADIQEAWIYDEVIPCDEIAATLPKADCPVDLVISDFLVSPDAQEYIDIQNIGDATIDFAGVTCAITATYRDVYLAVPSEGTLAPGETLRFGASGSGADVDFPNGTLRNRFSGLALVNREDVTTGESIMGIQPDIVTSLVYLGGGTVFGFYHTDSANAMEYCSLYDGELHPFGESQCTASTKNGPGFSAMMESGLAEAGEEAEVAAQALVALYPNPLTAGETLTLGLPVTASARVEAFDVLGRSVAVLFEGATEAGEVALEAALETGVYLVRVTTAEGLDVTHRLTVVR